MFRALTRDLDLLRPFGGGCPALARLPQAGPGTRAGPASAPATGPYGRRAGGGYIPDYIVLTMRRNATEP